MKKRLIDPETEMYTSSGRDFSREISDCIDAAVEKWFTAGYSVRDMQVIMQTEVSISCLSRLSENNPIFNRRN